MNFAPIRSLVRHTAIYSIGDFLGRAVAVVLLPLYVRKLSPADNGIITLSFAFIGFTAVFYSLGLNQALVRFLSGNREDDEHLRRRFSTAFLSLLLVGTTVSTLIWVNASRIAAALLGTSGNADIVRALALIVLLDTLSEPLFSLCRARQQSVRFALTRLCQHTIQVALIVYLILFRDAGVRGVFTANVASSSFALLAMAPVAVGAIQPVFRAGLLRELLAFGLPFVPSAVAVLVISLSDRFLIEHLMGLDQLGIYGVAYKFSIPALLVVRAFRSAWAPGVLSVHDPIEARAVCARVTTYFIAAASLLLLFVTGFSRELILLVGGERAPDYLDGHVVIPIVTLGHTLYGIYVILTAGVYAEGRARMLPGIVIAGAIVNVCINLLMIPRIGYIAAAWSSVAANGLMVVLLYLNTRAFYPVPYEVGRIGKVIVATLVVTMALDRWSGDLTLEGAIAKGIVLLAYPTILWGWRFLEAGEWGELRSLGRGAPETLDEKRT